MELQIATHTTLEGFFSDLLCEALAAEKLVLPDAAHAYLLQLMTEYAERDALYAATTRDERGTPALALLYQRAHSSAPHERFNAYRQLGDTALVVGGLFSPHIERSLVDLNYYVKMGGAAYSQASTLSSGSIFQTVLSSLASCFGRVVEVLTRVAEKTTLPVAKDVASLYERWIRSPNSEELQRRLMSQGMFPLRGLVEAV